MKTAHAAWPKVLALAAHELRTPAGVVSGVDLAALLKPLLPEGAPAEPVFDVTGPLPAARIQADVTRLLRALSALANLHASSGRTRATLAAEVRDGAVWLTIGAREDVEADRASHPGTLGPFDDLRGGHGLGLVLARTVIEAHGGARHARPGAAAGHEVTIVRVPARTDGP